MLQRVYNKKTYYEDDNFKVTLEELDAELFVHVQFFKFSLSILRTALKVWAEIKAKCYWLGYENIYTYTAEDRMQKFFPGSKVAGEFSWIGKEFKVLQWELN